MRSIQIGSRKLLIKDYYCSDGAGYLPRQDGRLWLYVNLTDVCPGRCPFCINPGRNEGNTPFDPELFQERLCLIQDHIYGVSLTGGEPMLTPGLVDDVIGRIRDTLHYRTEIDIVTNGIHFHSFTGLRNISSLDSIHLSRHRLTDKDNDQLFGFCTVTWEEIRKTLAGMNDPGAVVLNCILMKDGIDTVEKVEEYLEIAASAGVRNVSFIGMSQCNEYCTENYIDPFALALKEHSRFHIWTQFHDYDYCGCRSGSYDAKACSIRFYMRSVGRPCNKYTRQLVYTEDNRLLSGFGGEEIPFV